MKQKKTQLWHIPELNYMMWSVFLGIVTNPHVPWSKKCSSNSSLKVKQAAID